MVAQELRDPPQEGEGALGRREREHRLRGEEAGTEGFRVAGAGAPGGQEVGAVLTGKMLDGRFGTSFGDSEEPREERGLAVPELWL